MYCLNNTNVAVLTVVQKTLTNCLCILTIYTWDTCLLALVLDADNIRFMSAVHDDFFTSVINNVVRTGNSTARIYTVGQPAMTASILSITPTGFHRGVLVQTRFTGIFAKRNYPRRCPKHELPTAVIAWLINLKLVPRVLLFFRTQGYHTSTVAFRANAFVQNR